MQVELIRSSKRQTWRWTAVAAIWVGLVAIGAYLLRSDYALARGAGAPAPSRMTLRVDEWNDKLRLNWNPTDEPLRSATRAEVEISDGERRFRLPLSAAAIRTGNITYQPRGADVGFRVLTEGRDSAWRASESIWYIGRAENASARTQPGSLSLPLASEASRLLQPPRGEPTRARTSPDHGEADRQTAQEGQE